MFTLSLMLLSQCFGGIMVWAAGLKLTLKMCSTTPGAWESWQPWKTKTQSEAYCKRQVSADSASWDRSACHCPKPALRLKASAAGICLRAAEETTGEQAALLQVLWRETTGEQAALFQGHRYTVSCCVSGLWRLGKAPQPAAEGVCVCVCVNSSGLTWATKNCPFSYLSGCGRPSEVVMNTVSVELSQEPHSYGIRSGVWTALRGEGQGKEPLTRTTWEDSEGTIAATQRVHGLRSATTTQTLHTVLNLSSSVWGFRERTNHSPCFMERTNHSPCGCVVSTEG